MTAFDVVIVGSGINSLVCGAMLARRNQRVCILERNSVLGGCIRTEELTVPGFKHDTFSTLYPLFVTAPHYAQLAQSLAHYGLRFENSATPTGVLRPDGSHLVFHRDRERNIAALDAIEPGAGCAFARAMEGIQRDSALTFGLLGGEPRSTATLRLLGRQVWRQGLDGLSAYFADGARSCRTWLERTFHSETIRALFAPWVLHVGLSPESALSGLMCRLIMLTLEQAGSPMVAGGSFTLVQAFERLIRDAGGELHTQADVESVLVDNGAARGVRLADGREIEARSAVVCNTTPTQLYGRLLSRAPVRPDVLESAKNYRYGRAEMQIHLALDEPPQWLVPELGKVAMLHLTAGLDGVSRAVNEAERGLLPAEATIVVCQPVAVDASRAPRGRSILWIQLQELPRNIRGDARQHLQCPTDGVWTSSLAEAYADRIVERLCAQISNLRRSIMGRRVLGPHDLERLNINLVGGDPYSGACDLDQFLLWRPSSAARGHATCIERLFHIGASTHPGPGLGGMSGFLAAQAIA